MCVTYILSPHAQQWNLKQESKVKWGQVLSCCDLHVLTALSLGATLRLEKRKKYGADGRYFTNVIKEFKEKVLNTHFIRIIFIKVIKHQA